MAISKSACLAECVAMALFVIVGCGSAVAGPKDHASPGWVLMVALVFGLAITALAYSIGHYSGGHINCAVTFGLVLAGACPADQGVANILFQLVGSVIGAGILALMYSTENDNTGGGLGSNGVSAAFSDNSALIGETTGTFLLMFVVLQTAVNAKSAANRANACIAIGLAVFLAHILLIPIDGCSINPTRSFGPALVAGLRAGEVGKYFGDMWIFWLGPLVGSTLGVVAYKGFRGADDGDKDAAPSNEANFFSGIIAVVAYVYMFWVLVLQAPAFMINANKLFPSLAPYFPYSMDFNESRVDGLLMKILVNVGLAGFFVIPHSIFARPAVKNAVAIGTNFYRPLYTLMSSFQLHVLEIYWQPLTDPLAFSLWDSTGVLQTILLVVYLLGYLWLVTSTFAIDHLDLFGLKQGTGLDLYKMIGINSEDNVVKRFHYKVVRHPIMLGFFILFFCVPSMTFTHLFFSVACTAYNILAVMFLEEPDLKAELGDAYNEYANEVPAFCPFKCGGGSKKTETLIEGGDDNSSQSDS